MGLQIVKESDSTPRKVVAAVYSRVSTIGHGQDPEMQTRELTEYCQRRGWEVFDLYVDNGVSGKKDSRPQLNRLMQAAHERQFDVVVVWRFDRFTRSVSHLLRALETFNALGIQFVWRLSIERPRLLKNRWRRKSRQSHWATSVR
jgi:predicted site-specific integrase-resolvase